MQIIEQHNRIIARFPFNLAVIAKVKRAGMRWDPDRKEWWTANNAQNMALLRRELDAGDEEKASTSVPWMDYAPRDFLMQHQKEGVDLAKRAPRWLFAYETGTGKTPLAIEIILMKRLKTLVVCPLSIIKYAWQADLARFAPDLNVTNLWEMWKRKDRRNGKDDYINALNKADVAIVNFQGFGSQKEILGKAGFGMVIVDESSFVKSPKAQITKDLTKFCENVDHVYLMSGTPAPNSELEYYSQCRIIDPTVFGRSEWKFRNQWFYEYGFKWVMFPSKREEFNERLARCMSSVRKDDVLDLPEATWNIRAVELNSAEKQAYREMLKTLIAVVNDKEISAANAAVKIMKLRQITSGFLIDDEGRVNTFGKSKLNVLEELLEEIGNKQVVIWTQFQQEARIIKDVLKDRAGVVNGEIPQDERSDYIARFKEGSLQYLIAHPRSAGHGLTFTNASYAVYFSADHSYESWKQAADRINRYGQQNRITYYSLIVPESIDEVIYRCLQGKGEVQNAVLEYVKGGRK